MYHLSCITKNGTNPAYEGARIGASRVANLMGCEINHYFPTNPDNTEEQAGLMERALGDGTDAIVLAPTHPSALDGTINEIKQADIPLVYFVSRSDAIEAQTFVTADNYSLAVAIADYLIDSLGGAGDFVIVGGSPNSATSCPRIQGFLDSVTAHSDARVVAQCCRNYQRDNARLAIVDVLLNHPRVDGVLSANDYMALGIIDALAEFNRQSSIIGINAMPQAITAIKAGHMRATAAYDAMKMSCIATHAAIRILGGKAVPPVVELPVELVDESNCDLWDRPYELRPLLTWEEALILFKNDT